MATQNSNQVKPYKVIKLEDFFEVQLKMFKLIGFNIIPLEITSARTKIVEKLMKYYYFSCIFGDCLLVIQFGAQLLTNFNKLDVVVRALPNVTVFPYNFSKAILFYTKRKKILHILEEMRISFPATQSEQQYCNLKGRLKWFITLCKYYIVIYFGTVTAGIIIMITGLIFQNIRKQSVEIWYPFDDTANNLKFIPTIFWLTWTAYNAAFNAISSDFYIFASALVLSIEFSILGEELKNAINDGKIDNLREIIVRHQELIEISNDMKSLFTFIIFYTFLQGALSISFCGFQMLTATSEADLFYLVLYTLSSLGQVYLFCYFGEKLITATQDVNRNILESNWYELKDVSVKKSILFVILRSQKACELSGFGFVSLSVATFSNVSIKLCSDEHNPSSHFFSSTGT